MRGISINLTVTIPNIGQNVYILFKLFGRVFTTIELKNIVNAIVIMDLQLGMLFKLFSREEYLSLRI